jgi:hypothetical protein
MTTFVIDTDNNIAAHAEAPVSANETTTFASQKELAKLTAEWPISRLVEVWNSFAGAVPFDDLKAVKKFTDRKSAVGRIWSAVQRLTPAVAQQAPDVAPKKARSKKDAPPAKPSTKGQNDVPSARDGSKKAEVLEMMRRKDGATLAEIMKVTGWQAHTVRGFVAGTLKKMGVAVESFRTDGKERTYRVAK